MSSSTGGDPCVRLRPAAAGDREAVERLLTGAALPLAGVTDWMDRFWLAETSEGDEMIGVAGIELYERVALLRSVAIAPEWRGRGVAKLLSDTALEAARAAGAREVYLLTTTAEPYFARLGFACVEREAAPEGLQESAEFCGACPASAVLMRRALAMDAR